MKQLNMLSDIPIARNSDPVTSHLAAMEITTDGTRAKQQGIAYDAVFDHPDCTSSELARKSGLLDRYQMARRLPELEKIGLVRKGPIKVCSVTGKKAVTWWIRLSATMMG